jgi:hypothetical protein
MRVWLFFLLASHTLFLVRGQEFPVSDPSRCAKVGGKVIKGKADAKTCLDISNSCCVTSGANGIGAAPETATDNGKQQTGTLQDAGNLMSCKDKWTPVEGAYGCAISGTTSSTYFTYECCNPKPPGLSLVAIVAIILVVLVVLAGMAYIYFTRDKASSGKNSGNNLEDPLLSNDGMVPLVVLDGGRFTDPSTTKVMYRVSRNVKIGLHEGPDSLSAKTGEVLAYGETFEVTETKVVATDDGKTQTFLHVAMGGWAFEFHPSDGTAICERWSTKGVRMTNHLGFSYPAKRVSAMEAESYGRISNYSPRPDEIIPEDEAAEIDDSIDEDEFDSSLGSDRTPSAEPTASAGAGSIAATKPRLQTGRTTPTTTCKVSGLQMNKVIHLYTFSNLCLSLSTLGSHLPGVDCRRGASGL